MDYRTLKDTIKVISELENEILLNKLLEILRHNEIQKPEKHNRKEEIETSHFDINLTEDEINEIIDILQETQMKFVDDGDNHEQLFYHYSDLIDSWIDFL